MKIYERFIDSRYVQLSHPGSENGFETANPTLHNRKKIETVFKNSKKIETVFKSETVKSE